MRDFLISPRNWQLYAILMQGAEFREHRQRIANVFKANGVASGTIAYKSPVQPEEPYTGSELSFQQEALFYWLSGWSNPDSVIAVDIATAHSVLYIPAYDDLYQIWTGPIPTTESIVAATGVEEVKFVTSLDSDLAATPAIFAVPDQFPSAPDHNSLLPAAGVARRVKSPAEVDALRKASEYTSKDLEYVMTVTSPAIGEADVEAYFSFGGYKYGCKSVSFPTIVSDGQNAVYLHRSVNNGPLKDGDLLLVDCGLFYSHYAGDVSRTFPINGHFSEDQKLAYQHLLDLQKSLILGVHPGESFRSMNRRMFEGIFEVVRSLGIVSKEAPFSMDIARLFCPHSLTHHVGCNVHDLCFHDTNGSLINDTIDQANTLVPNMVITIEPGIYFHAVRLASSRSDPKYQGVDFDRALHFAQAVGGIRIEDDVLVTSGDPVVISTCPKEISEIEALMNKKK